MKIAPPSISTGSVVPLNNSRSNRPYVGVSISSPSKRIGSITEILSWIRMATVPFFLKASRSSRVAFCMLEPFLTKTSPFLIRKLQYQIGQFFEIEFEKLGFLCRESRFTMSEAAR